MPLEKASNRALVVIAHGSRSRDANQEFRQVLDKLDGSRLGYAHIEAAFLEVAEPSLPAVVECLSRCAVEAIDVYPMFFNCGRHVSRDIPALIESIGQQHPGISLTLLPYFGSFDGLAPAMGEHIGQVSRSAGRAAARI
jgi:sirohydrochlorin ferrochelatase